MTHQQILEYALEKKGAYVDFPFGFDIPIIKVKTPSWEKGKTFVQLITLKGEPKVTLSCTPQSADYYRSVFAGAVVRGWHCPPVQQPHFNTVNLDGAVPDEEIYKMIDHAYATVVAKLPKYVQRELLEAR